MGAEDGDLEIHHLDVGQADATLLLEPTGETMLIDSGDWHERGERVIDYLENRGVDRIDHLVATHGHADHIGGHDTIIDHYETERDGIGAAYDSGIAHTSQLYERYLDAIEDHDVDLFVVEEGDRFEFGTATVEAYNPPADASSSHLHYNSVALRAEFGEFTYLTTGDAEAAAEQRLANDYEDGFNADTYQAGHHGSSTSSTPSFMDAIAPDAVVISSTDDSSYDHPHDAVLEDYADRGLETYWTGVHGDVVLTTDGDGYSFETERAASTDAEDLLEGKSATESRPAAELVLADATASGTSTTETYTATLDRIVDEQRAVLLLENDAETVGQLTVERERLPVDGQYEGALFEVTADGDGDPLSDVRYHATAAQSHQEAARGRLDRLSTRLSDRDKSI